MHVHKPKPFHNAREFLAEILVIVIGVGIALGAEQLIEARHWRHQLGEAEAAMGAELRTYNLPEAMARVAMQGCLQAELDGLQVAVEDGRDRARIADLGRRYTPPHWDWGSEAWTAALASNAITHAGPDALRRWGDLYVFLPRLKTANDHEKSLEPRFRVATRGGALSASEKDRLLDAIFDAQASNRLISEMSQGFIGYAGGVGLRPAPADAAKVRDEIRRFYGDCAGDPLAIRIGASGLIPQTYTPGAVPNPAPLPSTKPTSPAY